MVPEDVAAAADVLLRSGAAMRESVGLPAVMGATSSWIAEQIAYLQRTDPDGSWVACADGDVVGLAQAARRDDYWVLAFLFVAPDRQETGIGTALLERAHAYGVDLPLGIIGSSPDPRAIRRYAQLSGFHAYPAFTSFGTVRAQDAGGSTRVHPGTRADLDHVARIDRDVRGSSHHDDLAQLLTDHNELLLSDDGYAIATPSGPAIVAARDDDTASDLLRAALRLVPAGGRVEFGRITGEQQWAIACSVGHGLRLRPQGPLVLRGRTPPTSYLPHGAYG
jgi:GNAT superfamily N-acetyltransferase